MKHDPIFKAQTSNILATSAKTKSSFSDKGSDRQCVIELLVLTQVLLQKNNSIKVVLLLKACKYFFQPYFYYPDYDLLIRTTKDIQLDISEGSGSPIELMGHFAYFLIVNKFLNMEVPKQLFADLGDNIKCGWKDAYQSSGSIYVDYLMPQKRSRQSKARKRNIDYEKNPQRKKVEYSSIAFE